MSLSGSEALIEAFDMGAAIGLDTVMGSWSFDCDYLNRLVTAANMAGAPASTPSVPTPDWAAHFCWAYDMYGNRLAQSTSNAAFSSSDGSCATPGTLYQNTIASYNPQNPRQRAAGARYPSLGQRPRSPTAARPPSQPRITPLTTFFAH